MPIRRAAEADVPAVTELLRDAGLPLIGVSDAFRTGFVAHDGDVLVGAAAIEPYDAVALLRSVVVRPSARGTGIGRGARCGRTGLAFTSASSSCSS